MPPAANSKSVRSRRPRAFSLTELIVVMVLTGIMAAAAIPAMSAVASNRRAVAAQQILRDMSYARQSAVATGTRTWVTFDAAGDAYALLGEDPSNPGRAGAAPMTDPVDGRNLVVTLGRNRFNGVTISGVSFDGAAEVGFDWLGAPLNSAESPLSSQGVVTLDGGAEIIVEPVTGLIRMVSP